MHHVRCGRGSPPLLFVHGLACDHTDWNAQLQALSPRHEVIACDLRGHGATPGRPPECSIEHYGGDVAALLAALALPPAVLVGHSMGCRVVLEAARLDPARIAALVLIDGSRLASGEPAAAEIAMASAIDAAGYLPFVKDFFSQMFLHPSPRRAQLVQRAMRFPEDIGRSLLPRMARWDAERLESALEAVRTPLLAIQSTRMDAARRRVAMARDETTPWLELVRARVPHARIEILPGVGHFSQLEAPEAVNPWLAEFVTGR